MEILLLLTTLIGLAIASTECADTTTASNFRLVANITNNDLSPSIQDWDVSSYHIGPCWDYATLVQPDKNDLDYSRKFYLSGTKTEVNHGQADVLTDGATPPTPYGIVVPRANETDDEGRRAVQIMCGMRTPGVSISGKRPHLSYHDENDATGVWYACERDLPYGSAVVLYYRDLEASTPNGCAELKLYPEWYVMCALELRERTTDDFTAMRVALTWIKMLGLDAVISALQTFSVGRCRVRTT